MAMNKSYGRTYDASPAFKWENASLAAEAGVNVQWETENATAFKYVPFNLTRIVNNGEADIWFYPNQDTNNGFFVPKGTIQTIDSRTLPAVSGFRIVNDSTTTAISAGKIIITNSREAQDGDTIVQRLHKRLFGGIRGRVV